MKIEDGKMYKKVTEMVYTESLVETKTVVTTKTTNSPAKIIDGSLCNGVVFSVVPHGESVVDLVIGAEFEHRFCSAFSKGSLTELVGMLKELADAME